MRHFKIIIIGLFRIKLKYFFNENKEYRHRTEPGGGIVQFLFYFFAVDYHLATITIHQIPAGLVGLSSFGCVATLLFY